MCLRDLFCATTFWVTKLRVRAAVNSPQFHFSQELGHFYQSYCKLMVAGRFAENPLTIGVWENG